MLANILKSKQAIDISIRIIEVFVKMREMLMTNKDILLKLEKVDRKVAGHDSDITRIFEYLKQLLSPPEEPRPKIGFRRKDEREV